jgi:hypothetical protein
VLFDECVMGNRLRCTATRPSPSIRSSADPVRALGGGGGRSVLSGGVGCDFDDEVSVEGCADPFQQRDRGDDAAGFQA